MRIYCKVRMFLIDINKWTREEDSGEIARAFIVNNVE
jgi:hypothetical protein